MYTTNGEKQATRALQTFEQVRYFFLQNSSSKQAPDGKVRIIAFSSEKEYKPYRMNSGAFAYYLPSRERDYIVMQDIEPEHHQAAVHEYTHLIVQHMKLELPIWLNEGMADLYSSLEPKGQQAMVGRALTSHAQVLGTVHWMDWNVLFAVDHASPYYNESAKMSIFYAQSWALTHMLSLSPTYGPKFAQFLSVIASGLSTPQALQQVYGKTVPEVADDVKAYTQQRTIRASIFDVSLPKSDLDVQVGDLSELQTGLALADLLASRKDTAPEAQRRLLALAQQYPKNSDIETSLGYLAWQQDNVSGAREQFALAVEHGSKSAKMLYDYAQLEQSAGAKPEAVIGLMEQVMTLDPQNSDARIFLASVELTNRRFGAALSVISQLHSVKPEQAFNFFAISAYCYANLKAPQEARHNAEKALSYAKTSADRLQIENVLQFLDAAERPATLTANADSGSKVQSDQNVTASSAPVISFKRPKLAGSQVVGTTKFFECGHNTFRLHVQVGSREMVFGMDDPQDIVVDNVKDLKWSCGPLKGQNVTVVYKPSSNPKLDGTLAELVF